MVGHSRLHHRTPEPTLELVPQINDLDNWQMTSQASKITCLPCGTSEGVLSSSHCSHYETIVPYSTCLRCIQGEYASGIELERQTKAVQPANAEHFKTPHIWVCLVVLSQMAEFWWGMVELGIPLWLHARSFPPWKRDIHEPDSWFPNHFPNVYVYLLLCMIIYVYIWMYPVSDMICKRCEWWNIMKHHWITCKEGTPWGPPFRPAQL